MKQTLTLTDLHEFIEGKGAEHLYEKPIAEFKAEVLELLKAGDTPVRTEELVNRHLDLSDFVKNNFIPLGVSAIRVGNMNISSDVVSGMITTERNLHEKHEHRGVKLQALRQVLNEVMLQVEVN